MSDWWWIGDSMSGQWYIACRYEDGCEFVVPCADDGDPTTENKARMIQHVATRHPRAFFEDVGEDCEQTASDMARYLARDHH